MNISDVIIDKIIEFHNRNGFPPTTLHITSSQLKEFRKEFNQPDGDLEWFVGLRVVISDAFALSANRPEFCQLAGDFV